jgi:hypothetical protein
MSIPLPPLPGAAAGPIVPLYRRPLAANEWCSSAVVNHFRALPHLFSVTPANVADKDFGFWLEYFWKEARAYADDRHAEVIRTLYAAPAITPGDLAALNNVQERRDLINARGTAAVTILTAAMFPATDRDKRLLLLKLLQIGFRDMASPVKPSAAMPATQAHFRHVLIHPSGTIAAKLVFRGDGSDFDAMQREGGRRNRVDLGLCNMGAAWHPFRDTAVGSKMWFRRSSGDNCLYSVTSVADKFTLAIGFPLIEDEAIYGAPCIRNKAIALWTPGDCTAARGAGVQLSLAELTCGGARRSALLLTTTSYLYLVKGSGGSVNTVEHAAAECNATYADQATKCDERGIRGVPLADFLVGFKLRRFHFGRARAQGMYVQLEACKYFCDDSWNDWDQESDKRIAAQHFNNDLQAATQVCNSVRKLMAKGHAYGENESDGAATKGWTWLRLVNTDLMQVPPAPAPGGFVYGDSGLA